jgi:predicted Zn-dependent protease
MMMRWLTPILALLLVFAVACPALAEFSMEDEQKLGKEFYERLKERGLLLEDPEVTAYITKIGNRIISQGERTPFTFTFSVVDSPGINAFATPGGYVYLYRGLIELTENESQLAGVMAHEIAHVRARHIADSIGKSKNIGIATLAAIIAGAFLGGGGDATAAIASFSIATATSLNLKYSRENEEEADRLGMSYLTGAGYDGRGMPQFLSIMKNFEYYSSAVPSYFLTHPGTDDRIRYLDALLEMDGARHRAIQEKGDLERVQTILVLKDKDPNRSLKYFQKALEKHPDSVDALYGLAVVEGRTGRTTESIEGFRNALAKRPDDPRILRDLGITLFTSGRIGEALDPLKKAHALKPADGDTLVYLGRTSEYLGDYPYALEMYTEYRDRFPDREDVFYNLAMIYGKLNDMGNSHFYFGKYFKSQGKTDSALFHFRKALPYFSADPEKTAEIEKEMAPPEKGSRPGPPPGKGKGGPRSQKVEKTMSFL